MACVIPGYRLSYQQKDCDISVVIQDLMVRLGSFVVVFVFYSVCGKDLRKKDTH